MFSFGKIAGYAYGKKSWALKRCVIKIMNNFKKTSNEIKMLGTQGKCCEISIMLLEWNDEWKIVKWALFVNNAVFRKQSKFEMRNMAWRSAGLDRDLVKCDCQMMSCWRGLSDALQSTPSKDNCRPFLPWSAFFYSPCMSYFCS